jgi:type IV secretion system protein TrbL
VATADTAVLDDFLNAFQSQVDSGFGLISGDVGKVFSLLVIISVSMTALLWALDEGSQVSPALVRKILLVGAFSWLITSWKTLSTAIAEGFAALGLKAGAGSLSLADFMQAPTKVVGLGLADAFAIVKYIGKLSQQGYGIGFFAHFDVIMIAALSAVGLIIAFIVLAVEVAVTVIEFHVVTLVAFVTIPFGVLSQTAFLAERAIAYAFAVGVKLMSLALVVSIGETVFATYAVSTEPGAAEECGLLLAAVLMVVMANKIPAVAAGLITGSPSLTFNSAGTAIVGTATAASGALLAARNFGALAAAGGAGRTSSTAAAMRAAGAFRRAPTGPAPAATPSDNAPDAGRRPEDQEVT